MSSWRHTTQLVVLAVPKPWQYTKRLCEEELRGRARCVAPGVSAAVAIAAWLGRALAVGVRNILGGVDV